MPIPDYQTLMLPVLEFANDRAIHTGIEAIASMSERFRLTPDERAVLLPSGRMRLINNRTHWALTYLRHAHLLASEGHGKFRITDRGLKLLSEKPAKIDRALLVARYPEILGLLSPREKGAAPADLSPSEAVLSPEEQLETSHRALRAELEHSILERLKSGSFEFFERAVLEVLVAMDYGGSRREAAEHVGKSGDGGIDGVINEDKLGLDKIYVQAKRWEGTVGIGVVREFVGSLANVHAHKGIIITTSSFVPAAHRMVDGLETRVVLVNGQDLVRYMVDYEIGVQPRASFTVYRVDEDFFEDAD